MVLGIRLERAGIASVFHNWSVQPSHWSWLRDINLPLSWPSPHGSKLYQQIASAGWSRLMVEWS